MNSAKCPCCKRLVPTNKTGALCSHGGGSCKCESLLCRWSGEIPPVKKRAPRKMHDSESPRDVEAHCYDWDM